jgi:hypothetical protein
MVGARGILVLLATMAVACGTPRPNTTGAYDAQLITEDEIDASGGSSAYDVIRKLRANFLSYRGETSFRRTSSPYPTVYVDGQAFGEISILRTIPAVQIATIRLYRAWEATTKFGTGNMGGVIAISTRR